MVRVLVAALLVLPGCMLFVSDGDGADGSQACTEEFRTVSVQIVDSAMQEVAGLATSTTHGPSGTVLQFSDAFLSVGQYVVVDDSLDPRVLTDDSTHHFIFEAHSATRSVTADFVISASKQCLHVSKVTGPDVLVLD